MLIEAGRKLHLLPSESKEPYYSAIERVQTQEEELVTRINALIGSKKGKIVFGDMEIIASSPANFKLTYKPEGRDSAFPLVTLKSHSLIPDTLGVWSRNTLIIVSEEKGKPTTTHYRLGHNRQSTVKVSHPTGDQQIHKRTEMDRSDLEKASRLYSDIGGKLNFHLRAL